MSQSVNDFSNISVDSYPSLIRKPSDLALGSFGDLIAKLKIERPENLAKAVSVGCNAATRHHPLQVRRGRPRGTTWHVITYTKRQSP
jgi:hypothetical protein